MEIPAAFNIEKAFQDYLAKTGGLHSSINLPEARHIFFGGWLMFFDAMYQNGEFELEQIETIMLDVRQQLETFFTKTP